MKRVITLSPSQDFLQGLPGGGVPDRGDFERYTTSERHRIWWEIVDRCRALADELHDLLETGRIVDAIQPL